MKRSAAHRLFPNQMYSADAPDKPIPELTGKGFALEESRERNRLIAEAYLSS